MKKLNNRLGLTLIILLILGFSLGCSKNNQPKDQAEIYTNIGFIQNILTENHKNFVEIGISEDLLKLEVKDVNIFNLLKEGDFYKFAFDENNTLLSIQSDLFLEDLIKGSVASEVKPEPKEDTSKVESKNPEPVSETKISSQDKISTDDLVLLDSFKFDINNNGTKERVAMYINAEQGPNDEIYWSDGHNWLLLVESEEGDYIFFDDYLQLGSLKFHVYTKGDDFYLTTFQSDTDHLELVEYKFNPDSNEFITTSEYQTSEDVNLIHATFSY